MVARMVRDHEVVGSNPVASTKKDSGFDTKPESFSTKSALSGINSLTSRRI